MTAKGYYSSAEKDAVRTHFDTPFIRYLRHQSKQKLTYFGLPGEDARDVLEWREDLAYVAAVERRPTAVSAIERLFETQLPEIQLAMHVGEADRVISANHGNSRTIGGQPHRPEVGIVYKEEIDARAWAFDVVNLDYYGAFLPTETGGQANARAAALRTLFNRSHQDSWNRWGLLLTTEASFGSGDAEKRTRDYLSGSRTDCASDAIKVIDALLSFKGDAAEEAARLIHGASAVLLSICASAANLSARPRGTVLYPGANGQPMIHLAYEFTPSDAPLAPPVARGELLRSPILRAITPSGAPWLESDAHQPPGVTDEIVAGCLDFIDAGVRASIFSPGS